MYRKIESLPAHGNHAEIGNAARETREREKEPNTAPRAPHWALGEV